VARISSGSEYHRSNIRSGSEESGSGNRAGERHGAMSDSGSMCGTRVPKIISRKRPPSDA
jgi:hypothetical protein